MADTMRAAPSTESPPPDSVRVERSVVGGEREDLASSNALSDGWGQPTHPGAAIGAQFDIPMDPVAGNNVGTSNQNLHSAAAVVGIPNGGPGAGHGSQMHLLNVAREPHWAKYQPHRASEKTIPRGSAADSDEGDGARSRRSRSPSNLFSPSEAGTLATKDSTSST